MLSTLGGERRAVPCLLGTRPDRHDLGGGALQRDGQVLGGSQCEQLRRTEDPVDRLFRERPPTEKLIDAAVAGVGESLAEPRRQLFELRIPLLLALGGPATRNGSPTDVGFPGISPL